MPGADKPPKWKPFPDENYVELMHSVHGGAIGPSHPSVLPGRMTAIPGVSAVSVLSYAVSTLFDSHVSGIGEFVVFRSNEAKTKSYNFGLGISSDNTIVFSGMHERSPHHHVTADEIVPIEQFFGFSPSGKKSEA